MRAFIRLLICSLLVCLQPCRRGYWGQLGLSHFPRTTFQDVPFPVELHLPGIHVVSLAASGTSVWIPFPISTIMLISYHSHILVEHSMCLMLMVVCMFGVRLPLSLFHLTLKIQVLMITLTILQAHCVWKFPDSQHRFHLVNSLISYIPHIGTML